MKILFLDDCPRRTSRFAGQVPSADFAINADQCIKWLQEKPYDIVFLDHDLGGGEYESTELPNTGSAVARWIAENKPSIGKIVLHSLNPAGRDHMAAILKNAGYKVHHRPFAWDKVQEVIDQTGGIKL